MVLRAFVLLVGLGIAGCAPGTVVPVVGGLGASVAIFHRSLFDVFYSGITGRDCSVVRLDEGKSYCRSPDPPVPVQPYCTRSLGVVDCWSDPAGMNSLPPQVADGPSALTPEQERYRLRRWPDL
jgi:hypothetical protein